MSTSSFGKRMLTRMTTAYRRLEQIDEVVTTAVPILQAAVDGNRVQIDKLSNILEQLKEHHSAFTAATGHLSESELSFLRHEVAHIATFINAMDIYFSSDLSTVQSALEKFDIPILQEAYEKISDERFTELEEVVQKAKKRRQPHERKDS